MPCHELFDQQPEGYKNKILTETNLVVSIEASETDGWKKYTGKNGLNFGINDFGKSAPFKKIYDHFGLNLENIIKRSKKDYENKSWYQWNGQNRKNDCSIYNRK